MPTLAQIVNDHANVTLGEGEETITIEYRPRMTTTVAALKLARDMDAYKPQDASIDDAIMLLERLVQTLCDMMIAWDALEADGSTVPLTQERLEREDIMTLASLYGAIMADARRSLGELSGARSSTPISGKRTKSSTSGQSGASRSKSR